MHTADGGPDQCRWQASELLVRTCDPPVQESLLSVSNEGTRYSIDAGVQQRPGAAVLKQASTAGSRQQEVHSICCTHTVPGMGTGESQLEAKQAAYALCRPHGHAEDSVLQAGQERG